MAKEIAAMRKELAALKSKLSIVEEGLMTERNARILLEAKVEEHESQLCAFDEDMEEVWNEIFEEGDEDEDDEEDDEDEGDEDEDEDEDDGVELPPKKRGRPAAAAKCVGKACPEPAVKKPVVKKASSTASVPTFASLQKKEKKENNEKAYEKASACTVAVLKEVFKNAGKQGFSRASKGELMKELGHARKWNAEQKKKCK